MPYLPMTRDEVLARGWDTLDFVYICGDAYVDHPSFGAAIICRTLEAAGYSVGIIAQPDWKRPDDFFRLGRPRLAWLVSAGNLDSMVDHYTVAKKRRHQDMYTPGGEGGKRPDRAVIVYCNKLREQDKTTPILIGGIEASLRRLAHYDYWDDKVRRSILLDSGADLLMYGMGERSILEVAEALDGGVPVAELTYLPGTVYKTRDRERPENPIFLPTYRELLASKQAYAQSFLLQYQNTDPFTARPKWTVPTPCPLCGAGTLPTMRPGACPPCRRSSSAWSATGAALAAATFVPWPSIRGVSFPPGAMPPCCGRPRP